MQIDSVYAITKSLGACKQNTEIVLDHYRFQLFVFQSNTLVQINWLMHLIYQII